MFRKKHKRLSSVTVELRQISGDCRNESLIYKCTATTCNLKKLYLGLTEEEFKKQRYYDHVKSFKNQIYASNTTISSYLWQMKRKGKKVTPILTWEVLQTAKAYSNISRWCFICLHEKLANLSISR